MRARNISIDLIIRAHLVKQGLVEEKPVGKGRFVYATTQRGRIVINAFKELEELLPVTKESLVLL